MDEILYVDHSSTSQILMRKYLEGVASLTPAASVDAAIALLADHKFQLMIAGYDFAEGNALPLIEYIRASQAHKKMPVIVISSSMDDSLFTRIIRAGANDGMAKPLQVEAFRAMVTRMLTSPYVRHLENQVIDVSCFRWHSTRGVCEYCPELDITVTGSTKEEAAALMSAALQKCGIREGMMLGNTSNETVVRHEVRLPGIDPATEPAPKSSAEAS
jgi:CheY-like chemotaxis protein